MDKDIIVLAAGKGTRMYSSRPKVLHAIAGRPMLAHVIDAAQALDPRSIRVVIGHGADEVRSALSSHPAELQWILQQEQLGTGHAVQQAASDLDDTGSTLVLYGDVPLIGAETLQSLLDCLEDSAIAVLTTEVEDPHGLGRIIRNAAGAVSAIVEEKDATPDQRRIKEINTGILCARNRELKSWLQSLDNDNAQGEYYLTDIVAMAHRQGLDVASRITPDQTEVQGVNNRLQLSQLERACQRRQAEALALQGVTVMDLDRLDIRGELECGRDVEIDVNTLFEGKVVIGDDCRIGANVIIRNSVLDRGVVVLPNSHIDGATIGSDCTIGPFARLRPDTVMEQDGKIGNFVETKKSVIGKGSKINHLSYIGDSHLGDSVNVGAGTITCNYDGVNKHRTIIGDGVFIGSNSALVAPVHIGSEATVAAGSVITSDVPASDLAVGRGRQRNISGWKKPQKKHD